MVALFKGVTASTENKTLIPAKFICPLTNKIMKNPVRITGSKFPVAYEESALDAHFEEHGYIDPKTKIDLGESVQKTFDFALQREINDFLKANPALIETNDDNKVCIYKPL